MGCSRLVRNLQQVARRYLHQSSVPFVKPRLEGSFADYVTFPIERKSQFSLSTPFSTLVASFDQFDSPRVARSQPSMISTSGRTRACCYEQRCSHTSGQNFEGKERMKKCIPRLPEPTDEENDMLDLAFGLTETSRLGCQVIAKPELDGLQLALPAATRNFAVDGHVPKPH